MQYRLHVHPYDTARAASAAGGCHLIPSHSAHKRRGAPQAPPLRTTRDNQQTLRHLSSQHSARPRHRPQPPLVKYSGSHSRPVSQMLPFAPDTPNTSGASNVMSAHWDRLRVATTRHSSLDGHTLHSALGTSWRTNRIQVRVVVRPRRASMRSRHRHPSISRALRRVGCAHSISRYPHPYSLLSSQPPRSVAGLDSKSNAWRMPHAICYAFNRGNALQV